MADTDRAALELLIDQIRAFANDQAGDLPDSLMSAIAAVTKQPMKGFALVPLRMTRVMREVVEADGWEWKDLLAAANAITAEQYDDECSDTVAADWFNTVVQLERMASAAMHQTPADQRNILEDIAERLSRLSRTAVPKHAAEGGAYQRALDIRIAQGWQLGGNACPILYTDTINDQQVGRDDLWLATTAGLKGSTPLPEEQKLYLDQAQVLLEEYAVILKDRGNCSAGKGAEASAHVLRQMLSAAPTAAALPALRIEGSGVIVPNIVNGRGGKPVPFGAKVNTGDPK